VGVVVAAVGVLGVAMAERLEVVVAANQNREMHSFLSTGV
jgi:hypothetical protein